MEPPARTPTTPQPRMLLTGISVSWFSYSSPRTAETWRQKRQQDDDGGDSLTLPARLSKGSAGSAGYSIFSTACAGQAKVRRVDLGHLHARSRCCCADEVIQ